MTEPINPADVMREHKLHKAASHGWVCAPATRSDDTPCLPYRLAEALAERDAKLGRTETLLGEHMNALTDKHRRLMDCVEDMETVSKELNEAHEDLAERDRRIAEVAADIELGLLSLDDVLAALTQDQQDGGK